MKILLTLVWVMVIHGSVLAQDRIYQKGTAAPIPVKILGHSAVHIRYRPWNTTGHPQKMNRVLLDSVVYENGKTIRYLRVRERYRRLTAEAMKGNNLYLAQTHSIVSAGYGVHQFFGDPFSKVYTTGKREPSLVSGLYVSYERWFLNRMIGIEAAPYIGFNERCWGITVAPRLYSPGDRRLQFGFGPEYSRMQQSLGESTLRASSLSFSGKLLGSISSHCSLNGQFYIGGVIHPGKHNKTWTDNGYARRLTGVYGARVGVGYCF
ncbi:hypothetical protein LQ567_11600 [Niabella pedocola]|uniref:Protochlamydia outer membrane protein domain-containing protein n=1 Tax=Niabella pedocola TaxID=1752077 RepID=A0ABS8PRH7_9BACT|nr:hypothetical protein [Niabella pedocola]MCD2423409.1 hypothetical protein [Niabella pedocola]